MVLDQVYGSPAGESGMSDYTLAPPNHPAAGKAGIASWLAIEHHCPGLPEPAR